MLRKCKRCEYCGCEVVSGDAHEARKPFTTTIVYDSCSRDIVRHHQEVCLITKTPIKINSNEFCFYGSSEEDLYAALSKILGSAIKTIFNGCNEADLGIVYVLPFEPVYYYELFFSEFKFPRFATKIPKEFNYFKEYVKYWKKGDKKKQKYYLGLLELEKEAREL